MQYLKLYEDFKNLFPEDASEFKKYEEDSLLEKNDNLIHVCFEDCVNKYVFHLLKQNCTKKIKIAFAFFEKMANDIDSKVQNVLQVAVLEDLATHDKEMFKKSIQYMGPMTKKFVNQIASYMNIEPIYEAYH